MLRHPIFIALLLILLFVSEAIKAQKTNPRYFRQLGLQLLTSQQYEEAHTAFLRYQEAFPKDNKVLLPLAICSYHTQSFDEMEVYLNNYAQSVPSKAMIYHLYEARRQKLIENYREAARYYKKFLQREKLNLSRRKQAKQELRQCGMAIRLAHRIAPFTLVDNDEQINTTFDEYLPIASPNYEEVFYFSSNRRSNVDIYVLGEEPPKLLDQAINTAANEYLLGFGCNGQSIYFQRDSLFFIDTFAKVAPQPIDMPYYIEPNSIYFFCDSILLFASDRLEGFGGYDLFYSRKLLDVWSTPKNLGATINSAYDEKSPFLDQDGRSLYFSSNDPTKSIGGYDILRCVFEWESKAWSAPENMGTTINSNADELDFNLNEAGTQAYFTSNHWNGQGGKDVYTLEWKKKAVRTEESFFFDDFVAFQQEQAAQQVTPISLDQAYYRIQLKKSKLDTLILPESLINPQIKYNEDTKFYCYSFGLYQSFESALAWCEEVQKKGWEKAKVIAYLGQNEIKLGEIEELINTYGDLQYYLEYLKEEK
ncbi:MAG: hypothetical protein AAF849_05535 [Bacteroidota bacterium]